MIVKHRNSTPLILLVGMIAIVFMLGEMILVSSQIQPEGIPISGVQRQLDETNDDQGPQDPIFDDENGIDGQYIIKFTDDVSNPGGKMRDLIMAFQGDESSMKILWEYKSAFKGVTISGVPNKFFKLLEQDNDVEAVEQDVRYELDDDQQPWSWGLDRIDQLFDDINPDIKFDNRYHYDFTGSGVSVVVMDSGILKTHLDFLAEAEERVICAFNAFQNDVGESCEDRLGHGTFVAGIIGGRLSGVAKKVELVNVKVVRSSDGFLCAGSILAGLDYVYSQKLSQPELPIVVNLSFSGPKRESINEVIHLLVYSNIFVVASAGNDAQDACTKSPASAEKAITVGSTNFDDTISLFSNYGSCVDIFAPGKSITSTWIRSDTDMVTLSGTSMAAAHVTGVIALMLEVFGDAKPADIEMNLKENAFQNVLTGNIPAGSPNLLLRAIDSNMEK